LKKTAKDPRKGGIVKGAQDNGESCTDSAAGAGVEINPEEIRQTVLRALDELRQIEHRLISLRRELSALLPREGTPRRLVRKKVIIKGKEVWL